ncbi:unnamed protein product [Ambrosiozyma monospora]|uniref:Unnamed protein product n=1 Tax=Ambrosiozyma monospora TaxID=43982 RepID=A0ACB5SR59_AMBMO|nr:unnamed protein product [Ambrosiozyma monospora]
MLTDISNRVHLVQKNPNSKNEKTTGGQKIGNARNGRAQGNRTHKRKGSCAGSGNYHGMNKQNINKQNIIKPKPSYKFSQIYQKQSEKMFPFMHLAHLIQNPQDEIDFTLGTNFPSNLIKKYSQPLKDNYTQDVEFMKPNLKIKDPMDAIFNAEKNRSLPNRKAIRFGEYEITVGDSGKVEEFVKKPEVKPQVAVIPVPDTPIGSKRSLQQMETIDSTPIELSEDAKDFPADLSLLTSSSKSSIRSQNSVMMSPSLGIHCQSSVQPLTRCKFMNKRLKTLKVKHRNEKLDNSMTISAKAIMKMVDDSLVSSDTEFYTQTMTQIHAKASISNLNEKVSINASDLESALKGTFEEEEETENKIVLGAGPSTGMLFGKERVIRNTRSTIWKRPL